MAAARGRVEPAPRRVRGFLGHELVFDTTSARYVWEVPYYPQYYIPLADVRTEFLRDENHPQKVQFGPSRLHSVVGAGLAYKSAARVFDADSGSPVAGTVRFEWDKLRWFEEDEPIYGHPRNPYSRVDALRSHRHIRVELDGVVLADTHTPVLLFETGLPTRYYIDPTDVGVRASRTQFHPDAVPVQRGDVGLLVGARGRHRPSRPRLDVSLPAAGGRPDRGDGGLLQREARYRRRRCGPRASAHPVQLATRPATHDHAKPSDMGRSRPQGVAWDLLGTQPVPDVSRSLAASAEQSLTPDTPVTTASWDPFECS